MTEEELKEWEKQILKKKTSLWAASAAPFEVISQLRTTNILPSSLSCSRASAPASDVEVWQRAITTIPNEWQCTAKLHESGILVQTVHPWEMKTEKDSRHHICKGEKAARVMYLISTLFSYYLPLNLDLRSSSICTSPVAQSRVTSSDEDSLALEPFSTQTRCQVPGPGCW